MYQTLQFTLFLGWAVSGGLGFLIKRDPVSIAVPITGNLTNTSAHYDPVSWTLWNPVFNQTTWEAQPYVPYSWDCLTLGIEWIYWTPNPR